ncbi:MAG TPA: LapA family protein, partial [bacterium]|nr:LapA family protein [bacterium]
TVFAISNTEPVQVMFWQWPIYTGSLALAIVGAGVLGALLTLVPSMIRHAHLHGRLRDLERRLAAHEAASSPTASGTPPPGTPAVPPAQADIGQTRRLW